jgi:hypothetical protein
MNEIRCNGKREDKEKKKGKTNTEENERMEDT